MKKTLWLGLTVLVFFSCCTRKISHPPLSKEKLIPIMIDIQLAEAEYAKGNQFEKGRAIKVLTEYDKIFLKHNVNSEDFYTSFAYYRQHPKEMDELYQEVIEEMTKRESELNKQSKTESKDSVIIKNGTHSTAEY